MSLFGQPGVYTTDPSVPDSEIDEAESEIGLRAPKPRSGIALERCGKPMLRVVGEAVCSAAILITCTAAFDAALPLADVASVRESTAPESSTEFASAIRDVALAQSIVYSEPELRTIALGLREGVYAPGYQFALSEDGPLLSWMAKGRRLHVLLDESPREWRWWTIHDGVASKSCVLDGIDPAVPLTIAIQQLESAALSPIA